MTWVSSRCRVPLAAAALALTVLGGGCSSGGTTPRSSGRSPSPSASMTTAPSPSTGPSPTAEVPPAAPVLAKGPAGEKAFARHVMDLWGYAVRTNDSRPLTSLAAGRRPCGGCPTLTTELAKRRKQGWSVDFPGLTVHTITLGTVTGTPVARAAVDIPETDSYNSDGSYRNTNPAHQGVTFGVQMRWTPKGYRLVSFTLG